MYGDGEKTVRFTSCYIADVLGTGQPLIASRRKHGKHGFFFPSWLILYEAQMEGLCFPEMENTHVPKIRNVAAAAM